MALGQTTDPKLFQSQIRNLFSSGQPAATNSPLAFMEKSSTATKQLLAEQMASNDTLIKVLNRQVKLLEDIKKDGGGSGDSKLLGLLGFGAGLKGLGLFKGLGGKSLKIAAGAFGAGLAVLRTGLPKLSGEMGTRIVAFSKSFLGDALQLLGRGLKPLKSLGGVLGKSGAFGWVLSLGSKISSMAKFIPKLASKLAWPIMALLAVFDGWKGFKESKAAIGENSSLLRRIEYAKANIINGFLLGIPDWISNKLFGKKFGSAVDDAITSVYSKMSRLLRNSGVEDFKRKMSDLWSKLPKKEEWQSIASDIRDKLFDLGAYLKSSFISTLDSLRNHIRDALSGMGLSSGMPPAIPGFNDDYMKLLAPKPPSIRPRTNIPPTNVIPQSSMPPISPSAYRAQQSAVQNSAELVFTRSYGYASPVAKEYMKESLNMMGATGGALVSSVSGGMSSVSLTSEKAVEEDSEGFFDTLSNGFDLLFKDIGANAYRALKSSINSALSKESMDTLKSIITGNGQATDIGNLLGSGGTSRSAIPGIAGVSGPGGEMLPPKFSNTIGGPLNMFNRSLTGPARPLDTSPLNIAPNGFVPYKEPLDYSKIKTMGTRSLASATSSNLGDQLKNELVKGGATEMYARALVGNMGVESRYQGMEFNPQALGDSGSAYGLKQWRKDRRENLHKFAKENGLDPTSRSTQLKFALEESTSGSKYADKGAVRARQMIESGNMSLPQAVATITELDERADPNRSHIPNRVKIAEGLGSSKETPSAIARMLTEPSLYKMTPGAGNFQPPAVAGIPGGDFAFTRSDGKGVDPRLVDILQSTAKSYDSNYKVNYISGLRPGDGRRHGKGIASDIELIDKRTGKVLDNYQNAATFREYEKFAQAARVNQRIKYPELNKQFTWGGYFSGPKGKYGALDLMHFDLGGVAGGGSWAQGLTEEQKRLWPGIVSQGMGNEEDFVKAYMASNRGGVPFRKVAISPVVSSPVTSISSNRFGSPKSIDDQVTQSSPPLGMDSRGNRFSTPMTRNYSPWNERPGISEMEGEAESISRPPTLSSPNTREKTAAINPGKPPMKPSDPNINSPTTPPPPINTIPTTDELSMLMINSEAVA